MAWTNPRTWTIGEKVTKAIQDAHIRDNLLYLFGEAQGHQVLPIQSAIAPMSGYASAALQLIESSGAGTAKPVIYELLFDATTDEGRMWVFKADRTVVAASIVLKIGYYMKSSNTSAKVKFSAQLACVSDTDASVTAKVFASANTVSLVCPDAIGTVDEATITMTNYDSMTKGDWCCLFFQRVPSDTTNDTATGDAAVISLELQYG